MTVTDTQAEPVFSAVLRPYRSLNRQGFGILMGLLVFVSVVVGLAFSLIGAWPVIGFLGIDLVLLYLAFKWSYRTGSIYEKLKLWPDRLVVERYYPHRRRQIWTFHPYWARLELQQPLGTASKLILRSHGRTLNLGAFLSEPERSKLAADLKTALVRQQRSD